MEPLTIVHRHTRFVIVAAAVAGLIARLAFGLGYWVNKPLTHDESEYLTLARNLADGKGLVYDTQGEAASAEHFGRAPLYPAFLAAVARDKMPLASAPASVKAVQSLLGSAVVLVIGLTALRVAGPPAGVAAAVLAAFYPPLVWMPAYVLSETLYSLLALSSALLLCLSVEQEEGRPRYVRGVGYALVSGILAGLGILTRPSLLFFLLLAVPWLVVRRRAALAAAVTLGAIVVVGPWAIRNLRTYDRFVLVASEGGVTFWTGNHPLARGEGDMAANPAIKRANVELRGRYPGLSPETLEPIYYREALAYIAAHPLWWFGLVARKFFYLWVPIGPSYTLHSARYLVTSVASYAIIVPFAIAGIVCMRRRSGQPSGLWLLAASAILTCLIFFPQERFRIPVIDPTLIVLAGVSMAGRIETAHREQ